MRACYFLPAATTMIQQMKLDDLLWGVTFECPSPLPKVLRSVLEDNHYSSLEIDHIVSQAKAKGQSLYYIDEALLAQLSPDIIFTQDVCDVCQVDTSYVQRAVHKLNKQPVLVPLIPHSLHDVYDNAVTIAKALGKEENAYHLLAQLKKRTGKITDTLRCGNAPVKRVMILEWIDPIYNCGHWIPDMIALAGGTDMMANPSGYSITVLWDKIIRYNPEVLVIAPCGFKPQRTLQEINMLTTLANWNGLAAVKNNAVYIADSDIFTCPSTKLVDGIELLAFLFHPALFKLPLGLCDKVIKMETELINQ